MAVYHSPSGDLAMSDFIRTLGSTLDNFVHSAKRLLCVVSDFNVKSPNCRCGQSSNDAGVALSVLMTDLGLSQLVDGPTRCVGESSAAQLDLMFVSDVSVVESTNVLSPVSDYCPTLLGLRFSHALVKQYRTFWDFNNGDFDGLNNHLSSLDWSPVFESSDAEEVHHSFC